MASSLLGSSGFPFRREGRNILNKVMITRQSMEQVPAMMKMWITAGQTFGEYLMSRKLNRKMRKRRMKM